MDITNIKTENSNLLSEEIDIPSLKHFRELKEIKLYLQQILDGNGGEYLETKIEVVVEVIAQDGDLDEENKKKHLIVLCNLIIGFSNKYLEDPNKSNFKIVLTLLRSLFYKFSNYKNTLEPNVSRLQPEIFAQYIEFLSLLIEDPNGSPIDSLDYKSKVTLSGFLDEYIEEFKNSNIVLVALVRLLKVLKPKINKKNPTTFSTTVEVEVNTIRNAIYGSVGQEAKAEVASAINTATRFLRGLVPKGIAARRFVKNADVAQVEVVDEGIDEDLISKLEKLKEGRSILERSYQIYKIGGKALLDLGSPVPFTNISKANYTELYPDSIEEKNFRLYIPIEDDRIPGRRIALLVSQGQVYVYDGKYIRFEESSFFNIIDIKLGAITIIISFKEPRITDRPLSLNIPEPTDQSEPSRLKNTINTFNNTPRNIIDENVPKRTEVTMPNGDEITIIEEDYKFTLTQAEGRTELEYGVFKMNDRYFISYNSPTAYDNDGLLKTLYEFNFNPGTPVILVGFQMQYTSFPTINYINWDFYDVEGKKLVDQKFLYNGKEYIIKIVEGLIVLINDNQVISTVSLSIFTLASMFSKSILEPEDIVAILNLEEKGSIQLSYSANNYIVYKINSRYLIKFETERKQTIGSPEMEVNYSALQSQSNSITYSFSIQPSGTSQKTSFIYYSNTLFKLNSSGIYESMLLPFKTVYNGQEYFMIFKAGSEKNIILEFKINSEQENPDYVIEFGKKFGEPDIAIKNAIYNLPNNLAA